MVAVAGVLALPARANTWPLPPSGSRLVGQNQFHVVQNNGGSLEAIAKKYNVGFLALLQANPGVDPYVPRAGSVLTIPLQTLLPEAPREGLVINLAELRLYYYPPGKNEVTVYPIGIGQLGGDTITPTMVTTVSDKRANPTWTPTANIRARYKAMGIELPAWCLPGRITRWATMLSALRPTAASICCTAPMPILASACASAPAVFACAMTTSKPCTTTSPQGRK
jgi:L,D-transpeptidase YcfS